MYLDVALLTLYNKSFENSKRAVLNKQVLDQLLNAGIHKIALKIILQKLKQMNRWWWPTPVTPEPQFQKASAKEN